MQTWLRRKDIDQVTVHEEGRRLVPTLGWPHLVALGIGAIVGTGIYTLIGVGANLAGPGVLLSFLVAGVVCACAALASGWQSLAFYRGNVKVFETKPIAMVEATPINPSVNAAPRAASRRPRRGRPRRCRTRPADDRARRTRNRSSCGR